MRMERRHITRLEDFKLSYYILTSDISEKPFGVGVISLSPRGENKTYCFGLTDTKAEVDNFLNIASHNKVLPSNFGEVAEDWFC